MSLFLVYFVGAANDRVFGILLVDLRVRFPEASTPALTAVSSIAMGMGFAVGPLASFFLNEVDTVWNQCTNYHGLDVQKCTILNGSHFLAGAVCYFYAVENSFTE